MSATIALFSALRMPFSRSQKINIRPVDMLIPTTLNVSDAIFVPTFARPVILTWVWVNRSRAIDAREID